MAHILTTLRMMGLFATLTINDTQQKSAVMLNVNMSVALCILTLSAIMLCVLMLNVDMLSAVDNVAWGSMKLPQDFCVTLK
jgi:hypothetical protein